MRNLITKVLLACLLFSPLPAFAQTPGCTQIEQALSWFEQIGATHRVLDTYERKRAVDIYTNTPPEGQFSFDVVLLVSMPDGAGALIFGNGSELCAMMRIPAEALPQMKHAIEGPRA
jgi:hypothetical protein